MLVHCIVLLQVYHSSSSDCDYFNKKFDFVERDEMTLSREAIIMQEEANFRTERPNIGRVGLDNVQSVLLYDKQMFILPLVDYFKGLYNLYQFLNNTCNDNQN